MGLKSTPRQAKTRRPRADPDRAPAARADATRTERGRTERDQTERDPTERDPTERDRTDADRTLGRTAAWLAKQVELGLTPADLSLPQYRVLGLLDERSAVSSDLAERLAVRPPSVTAVVDGLVNRGLVERRTVVADRRQVDHVLTASGRRALDTADAAVAARLADIASCLSDPTDSARAFDGMAAWRRALLAYRLSRTAR